MRKRALRCSGLGLALLLHCLTVPSRALACVVGTGTGASCTESALNACLPVGGSFDGTVTFNCGGVTTLTVTGTKIISADTTIDGASLIAISGGHSVGVFIVNAGVKFTVQNLTIANGNSAGDGGGIASYGTLTVTNSTFFGNSAGSGGGIASYGGTLTVTNSTFSGNSAGDGGGIYNTAPRTVSISPAVTAIPTPGASAVVSVSIDNANSLSGFTIDVTYDNPTAVLATAATNAGTLSSSCFFVPNTAETGKVSVSALCSTPLSGSGALFQITFLGQVDGSSNVAVTKCNLAQGAQLVPCSTVGGTIVVGPLPSPTPTNTPTSISTLTVTNSTFSGNSAGSGGGIYNYSGTATVTNTIVANSTAGGNCAGNVTDGGHNIDDGTTCGFTGTGCTPITGTSFCNTNPVLDPAGLQNNGGPTQTVALCTGTGAPSAGCTGASPGINAGDESVCSTTTGTAPVNNLDQRGFVRPGTGATNCSIGAFEANSGVPDISLGTAVGRPGGIACVGATLATKGAQVAGARNDISFDSSVFSVSGCAINPLIGPGTTPDKQLAMTGLGAGAERVGVFGLNVIPDGPLYSCTLAIGAGAGAGSYALGNVPGASDPTGADITPVSGAAGAVTVTTCTGDCNGNGVVSIGEVIKCVNMFLGQPLCNPSNPVLGCPVADANLNGVVSIGEVVQCVNRFLGGCP